MRKVEIEAYAEGHPDVPAPTYRQLDSWSRSKLLKFTFEGDSHGRFRDWPDSEVDVAFMVARLVELGFSVDLAFSLARTKPDAEGVRTLYLDGAAKPVVTVSVGATE